ncbi:MAG TPA: pyridoxamine 5'-phosphate oxidase [Kofleriaceae bacterium]|nr:pyridoxamine 5'-phosphate oxidase [Kofleriaceae bacterium]
MKDPFEALRREYEGHPLRQSDVADDPLEQFGRWFDQAVAAELPLANAMSLATADARGRPSVRIVLLKSFDERGFSFVSNYDSRKGRELAANPVAALCLYWEPLHRQIRVSGPVERADPSESDALFAGRPRASNLSGMASQQSEVVADRAALEARVAELEAGWEGRVLERPPSWGGFRLVPDEYEFWQGRPDRLHDRIRYQRDGLGWRRDRLCP